MSKKTSPEKARRTPDLDARTWMAVFDGGRAVVFQNTGFDDAPSLRLVFGMENDSAKSSELGDDRPGRFQTPGGGRTAVPFTDLHDKQEGAFTEELARRVNDHAKRNQFDRLVIAAPAACIRRFRERAPEAYLKHVALRAGDFVHCPVDRIEDLFKELLAASKRQASREE
ncbi:MAG: host attachment protein [Parvularculaceae bacterium]